MGDVSAKTPRGRGRPRKAGPSAIPTRDLRVMLDSLRGELPPLEDFDACLAALTIVTRAAFASDKYADCVAAIKAAGRLAEVRHDRSQTITAASLAKMGDEEIASLTAMSQDELEALSREAEARG